MDYYSIVGRFARMLPAETAHEAAIKALRFSVIPSATPFSSPRLSTECFGLSFSNPVGMAAGFDKNAEVVLPLLAQGFGFVEAGTVTPLPQSGNPRPRLFRLEEDEAVINRLGFNNKGVHAFVSELKRCQKRSGIVGANIGKNKDSLDSGYDYLTSLEAVYPYVDYVTVNISSPNTVGLRDLQQKTALSDLMALLTAKRDELAQRHTRKPMLYKIAPDLSMQDKQDIVETALTHKVDGLIVTNTTVSRPETLKSGNREQRGGLSGRPLLSLSTETLRDIYRLSQGQIPLIGVGGISSAEDAYEKIRAGATLVQLYSALVYQGFGLVRSINEGLVALLERDGFSHLRQAIGTKA